MHASLSCTSTVRTVLVALRYVVGWWQLWSSRISYRDGFCVLCCVVFPGRTVAFLTTATYVEIRSNVYHESETKIGALFGR
jgi:hypothetical protein